MSASAQRYALVIDHENHRVIPASPLDNILTRKGNGIQYQFFEPIAGNKLETKEDWDCFQRTAMEETRDGKYLSTDHLITCVSIRGVHFIYVSLDNSSRASKNGFRLHTRHGSSQGAKIHSRLDHLIEVVNQIINNLGGKTVVFFSEACRPSFYGDSSERKDPIFWLELRERITRHANLVFLTERKNNEEKPDISFGISSFCTPDLLNFGSELYVEEYFTKLIIDIHRGSAAIGIRLNSGEIVWAVHFPLDFQKEGENNLGSIAMRNLQHLMDEYPNSACAFGDFNTIPGKINDAILSAIRPEYQFLVENAVTFYGAPGDWAPMIDGEDWQLLVE